MVAKQPAVYILASRRNGTLYIGVTSSLPKRVWEHKNDVTEGFTKRHGVHLLVWYELYDTMHKRKLLSKEEFEFWVMKAKFWFRALWSDSSDVELREGRERLRELLRPEEGYETEFRHWMVKRQIIPSDLVSDFKG